MQLVHQIKRGSFDFSALLTDGDLVMETGEYVTVPMIPHPVVLDNSTSAEQRTQSLGQALRASLSIVSEHKTFAIVDFDAVLRLT